MMNINLFNAMEIAFHDITPAMAQELIKNEMTVRFDEETGLYTIYDRDGNDVDVVDTMKDYEF